MGGFRNIRWTKVKNITTNSWPKIRLFKDLEGEGSLHLLHFGLVYNIFLLTNKIKEYVEAIKSIVGSLDDGAITPSAYDTAWVALIKDVNGDSGGPQFPSSLQWVVNHQLPDGSWGEPLMFSAFDRLLNTLACVITLTSWNIHPNKCKKGMKFVEENINKLGDEMEEHMTPGFELLFLRLLEHAQKLEITMPNDSPVLKEIYARRDVKLRKIPKDIFHMIPTILLHSLEGIQDLEWGKLLKLQSKNGSFMGSPSATAFAFMQTKDQNCLSYLVDTVAKFNGGVPNFYPLDMFERIWLIDRLQRLGIARYFLSEIEMCIAYIYRYWDEKGIGFARNCNVPDIDDTAMAFRVLRTNGYAVSADVFRYFEENGQFVCYPGQSKETVTVMFNLYRASQVLFPGEKILYDAKNFSHKFLMEKVSSNMLLDRWVISKDLPGEVRYALDVPWYASLPRLEARFYLEQYGGEDDVWIGKTLYRLPNINNNKYLEMAKLDYNHCQAIHQSEWTNIKKWYEHLNIGQNMNTRLLWSYYMAAASIFEHERRSERIAWAKTNMLLEIIISFFAVSQLSNTQAFIEELTNPKHHCIDGKPWNTIMNALQETINQISSKAREDHGVDIHSHLQNAWTSWLLRKQENVGAAAKGEAELIVRTINMSSGRWLPDKDAVSHPQYRRISSVTYDLCHQISQKGNDDTLSLEIESKMQELVQLVLSNSQEDDLDHELKQTFLTVAKTSYYKAYFGPETIDCHIEKVLFINVI
ncbi:ent-copalyl diphosphate synthase 1-like [Bidens hawaiensis]|uniref:ent-copalyl diphosphate synthase 1-like n=1 Tax=Bidens hawaiensis TaxID=980011 RepID=UPI00404A7CF5